MSKFFLKKMSYHITTTLKNWKSGQIRSQKLEWDQQEEEEQQTNIKEMPRARDQKVQKCSDKDVPLVTC